MVSMVAGQCVGHAGAAHKARSVMQTRGLYVFTTHIIMQPEYDHASALLLSAQLAQQVTKLIPACSLWSDVSVFWGQSSGVQLAHNRAAAW